MTEIKDWSKVDAKRCLTDTGYLARELLGFDYDHNEETGEITRPGGIYPTGPHQEMVEFLDTNDGKHKQLMCPRGARKTSILVAFCVRHILANPNIRILYAMQTHTEAGRTVQQVRDILEHNKGIAALFGDIRGDSKNWRSSQFTVGNRSNVALREPTMMAGGIGKTVTGSHPDIILLDDMVDWTNIGTPEAIDKPIIYLKLCFPLLEKGGLIVECGTPYDESDIHHHVKNELSTTFSRLEVNCGMEIMSDGKGDYELIGEPTFPHLTESFLKAELERMGPTDFAANYCLKCASPENQLFFREHFKISTWQKWMSTLSGYILTDTATSDNKTSNLNVIALVLMGHDDTAYLADMRVGIWKPDDFVENLLDMTMQWRPRCRLHLQTLENVSLNHVYRAVIEQRARERQIPIRLVGIPRGVGHAAKKDRIKRLQPRFVSGKFIVLNTVPEKVMVRGKEKVLFNPNGWQSETGELLPDGMLVDQFIRPNSKLKDIPDCLADIEASDSDRRRICVPSPKPAWQDGRSEPRRKWRVPAGDQREVQDSSPRWMRESAPAKSRWSDLASRNPK